MPRRNINFTDKSFLFLTDLKTLSFNAHVQRAVDIYIEELKLLKGFNVSSSQSERRENG